MANPDSTPDPILRHRSAHPPLYEFTLFVNGASERSGQAITNVRALCDTYLLGQFRLDIVDIFDQPELVSRHRILAAPTLVKEKPLPIRKMVGDLSDPVRLLRALDFPFADGSTC